MWILLSLFGAFFQASEMAIKKKALKTKGMNNFIAFSVFIFAAFLFAVFLLVKTGSVFSPTHLSQTFWLGIAATVFVNAIATYFLYKALDLSELSYLMPYMTLTSLTIIIPPIFLFKEYPSPIGLIGIAIIVVGAFLMDYKNTRFSEVEITQHRQNKKGLWYFLVTAACFTISPSVTKLAVIESTPLFATFLIHLLMGIIFGIFILLLGEKTKVRKVLQTFGKYERSNFFIAIFLAAISIAISNISINYAYESQSVAYVMAIKRIMPLFAFVIGYFYFHEKTNVKRKLLATSLMVLGAMLVTVFSN